MNFNNIDIILNIFYEPTDELKKLIEENFYRNEHPYLPINGGSGLKNNTWCKNFLLFDDTGDNISNLNNLLNEMTSIYWYWKNNKAKGNCTHVGFNHYRRFFKFDDIEDYADFDIIVSKPIWSSNEISLAYQYKYYHVLDDLQTCIDVIRNEFDYDWGEGFRKYLLNSGTNYAPCNMFVMKNELFEEWCSFLFPILFSLEKKICHTEEFQKRDNYQKRALCFLTERMFNYWYYLKKNSGLKTKEVDIEEHLEFKPKGINERGDFSQNLPKVALVAIAKDEDNYLKEWVDYHLKIGFSEIFVYQNNWRYTRGDINDKRVHLEVLDGHRMQNPCYNNFIKTHFNDFDFAAFFDVDEFLYIRDGKTIEQELYEYGNVDSIFINWRLFGDSGKREVLEGNYSVINRFIMCDDKLHSLGKQIINLRRTKNTVLFNNPHILQYAELPLREFKSKDPNLKMVCSCGTISNNTEIEKMELYHFRNKTWEENVKRKFGTDDAFHEANKCDFRRNIQATQREFDKHNKNTIINVNLIKSLFERKYKSLLCCIAKDEQPYINEWIEYHLKIGFDKIVVFCNNWNPTIDQKYTENVILIPFNMDDKFTQNKSYNTCIDLFYDCFEWIAFFDVDEFLVLKNKNDVNSWLDCYEKYDAVGVNWRYYGSNGLIRVDGDYSTINRFTKCAQELNCCIKTILHVGKTGKNVKMHVCCHCTDKSLDRYSTVAVDGKTFIRGPYNKNNLDGCIEIAWLAHFRCRSLQEWNEKCNKNSNGIQRGMKEYDIQKDSCFVESDRNDVEDLTMVQVLKN